MLILLAKLGIVPNRHLGGFHQQHAQKAVALFADSTQPLLSARTILARDQPQITGDLLTPLKPACIPDVRTKANDVIGPTPGCVISRRAFSLSSAAFFT